MLRRWLKEPLLHFLVLGSALFAIDRLRPSAAEKREIVVDAARVKQLSEDWALTHGAPPDPATAAQLVNAWVDDEILYREGLARGFDQNDDAVRQRVILKMSFVVSSTALEPQPAPDEVRAWFDANPAKWARPPQLDFTQVFVEGNDADARATELLRQLEAGADPAGLGDRFSGGRRFRDRQLADLEESFGPEFATALAGAAPDHWVKARSKFGVHLVRVDGKTPRSMPSFETVALDVRADWDAAKKDAAAKAELARLKQRWSVRHTP